MRKHEYKIRLETTNEERFHEALYYVGKIAKKETRGERSNLDLLYILDDEGKARVKFEKMWLPLCTKVIKMTDAVDFDVITEIERILYASRPNLK